MKKSKQRKPAVECSTGTHGELTAAERHALPAYAFGLPELREYPMYRMQNGVARPDAAHARNAKARASQQHHAGNLSLEQLQRIDAKADRVLLQCGGGHTSARPRARHERHRSLPKPR
jgi:hypothetical protein